MRCMPDKIPHADRLGFRNVPSCPSACWCLTPQLAGGWVEPRIPEIKRVLLGRKRALEIRLSFRGYTPTVGTFIERESAKYFSIFAGQVRCLRRHSGPHPKSQALRLRLEIEVADILVATTLLPRKRECSRLKDGPAALARFHEILQPLVIDGRMNALATAQLRHRYFRACSFEQDTDLLFA
jgi:hypothetical protein